MNVYIENILAEAAPSATNLADAYEASLLYEETVTNGVKFIGKETSIEASWGKNRFIDTIAVLESNLAGGKLTVLSPGKTAYEKDIAGRGKNTIIRLPELFMVSGIRLDLHSISSPLEIGMLFAGRRTALPLFNAGFKYSLSVNGAGERTRHGIVYGTKKTSLRSFEITFEDIGNSTRLEMEEYIDAVQYVRPHIVEPYEADEFPPLWATLADAGSFDKQNYGRFRWNTALKYMEAK